MATGSVTEKAIDVVADVAEDVAEESTQVAVATRNISPKDISLIGSGVLFGAFVGSFATHFFLNKFLKTKYEKIADEEIANMKDHYDRKIRAVENEREKEKLGEVREEIKTRQEANDGDGVTPYHQMYQGGSEPDKPAHPDAPQVTNIFQNKEDPEVEMDDAWNYELELANRDPKVPYVIHRDEYNEDNEAEGYEKHALTFFEGDDVLCKEDDSIITDQDGVVGLGNLSRFGHGSGDPNIVYIRNEELKVDLEVTHSDNKYAVDVAGFQEDELQHSSMRRRSPRRSEYDTDR